MYFRYVQQKRIKALEAESKLKQVFVPNYTNKSTRLTGSNGEIIIRGKDCDAYPNLAKVMNIFSWNQFHEIFAKLNSSTLILPKTFVYLLVFWIILIWHLKIFSILGCNTKNMGNSYPPPCRMMPSFSTRPAWAQQLDWLNFVLDWS